MVQVLHKYIIENKKLLLPDIGLLSFENQPSITHFGSKTIHAPLQVLTINQFEQNEENNNLSRYLAKILKLSEEQAHDSFTKFCSKIKTDLNEKQLFYWPHLGTIQKDENDKIKFVQSSEIDYYQPPVHLEPLIKEGSVHNIKVGDTESTNIQMQEYYATQETKKKSYWWLSALILALGGIALIIMYYMGNT